MAEIDTVSKHLIQTYPADFVRFALQRDDIEDVEVIESEQPTVKARRTDSLLRVRIAGEEAWLEQCITRAAALPLDKPVKADFLAGLAILSELVYNPQTITAIVSKEHLMDLMRESSFAQYLAESAREEGMKQGIEQGIEQGIQESIQEVLALRFQSADMHPLARRIGAIDDVQRLKQLHRAAIQIPSLEAFRHLLDADE